MDTQRCQKMRSEWGQEIEKYLMTRKSLNALCIIMDIRHPFKEDDLKLIDWCETKDLPMILLLNKADKLSNNKAYQVTNSAKKLYKALNKTPRYCDLCNKQNRNCIFIRKNK